MLFTQSYRKSTNMEEKEKGFFKKRLMKRRVTFATITGLMHNKMDSVQEEEPEKEDSEDKGNNDVKEVDTADDITKNVGERIALFETETRLFGPDMVDESQGHDNYSFQNDNAVIIKSEDIDMQKFGEKGRKFGQFDDAKHVTYVSRGRTLITDLTNNRVQLINKTGRALMLYGGDEVAEPWASVLTRDGRIAVTSCRKKCVQLLNEDGDILLTFGKGFFQRPAGIAVDREGRFLVTDAVANRVSIHSSTGEFIEYLGKRDGQDNQFSSPRYICCSAAGDVIVSDTGNHCIKIFDKNGTFIKSFGKFGSDVKSFKFPYGVCTSKYGDIFVADHYNSRVSLYNRQGVFIRHIVTPVHGLVHPQGIALSPDFTLFITHGRLKASEILTVKLTAVHTENINDGVITHV